MKYLIEQQEKDAMRRINEAAKITEKTLCFRAKCGVVIVKDEKIIGKSYNASPLDDSRNRACLKEYQFPQKFKYNRTCCMHTEWRAIIDMLKNNPEK